MKNLAEVYALAYEQALMRLTASLTAQDMMTAKVITVPRHAGLVEVAEILRRQGISGVPVVDAGGRVAGVISAKDFLLRARAKDPQHILDMLKAWVRAGSKDSGLFEAQKAEELMSAPAITVTPETPLCLIADIFIGQGISRVPVVDGEGRLVGLGVPLRPGKSRDAEKLPPVSLFFLLTRNEEKPVGLAFAPAAFSGLGSQPVGPTGKMPVPPKTFRSSYHQNSG
jgi:CBS domain-containing protein